ncbi:hypothetical protein GMOD_00004234 [Pyrenophora seminiperda CCB06]|uniref:Uncharacterized protein n=1 Tax=Pyrenophora seminiperda CCB06 TaxID=1302712 RepID=A0A3M7M0M9_9PLEO|nr:hypothetical protein GMOD_00004234 [Pyrenophora seminiperda CCB06]
MSGVDTVDPPAPQVTVTKSGRSACDMRSNRVCRFANPCTAVSPPPFLSWSREVGQPHHGRLGREELEREVVGAIGQCINLIRNLLHLFPLLERDMNSGVAGEVVSWLQMVKEQKSAGSSLGRRRWGTDRRSGCITFIGPGLRQSVNAPERDRQTGILYSLKRINL